MAGSTPKVQATMLVFDTQPSPEPMPAFLPEVPESIAARTPLAGPTLWPLSDMRASQCAMAQPAGASEKVALCAPGCPCGRRMKKASDAARRCFIAVSFRVDCGYRREIAPIPDKAEMGLAADHGRGGAYRSRAVCEGASPVAGPKVF